MEIVKMIIMTTGHISKETSEWLDSDDNGPVVVYDKEGYGWLFPLYKELNYLLDSATPENSPIPADLLNVLQFAKKQGCTWLMLDCDAGIIEELPQFDW